MTLFFANGIKFWQQHPALAWGLSALLGACYSSAWLLIPCWLFYLHLLRPFSWVLHASIICIVGAQSYGLSHLDLQKESRALFSITSVQKQMKSFGTGWLYRGNLWTSQGKIPIAIWEMNPKRREANHLYLLEGSFFSKKSGWGFRPSNWEQLQANWSLAEWRWSLKNSLRKWLQQSLSLTSTKLCMALFTGEVEDYTLRYAFQRVGLSHLLAVSGFHFAILLSSFAFVLRALFSSLRVQSILLLVLATAYFLFLGDSPAVERTFVAVVIVLIGKLAGKKTNGLNLLGSCLFLEIAWNPLIVEQLGFQLSFLSCASILIFSKFFLAFLSPVFPKRSIPELKMLSLPKRAIAISSSLFAQSIALSLSVMVGLLPVLLFHFHTFPCLSLVYNLFAPPLAALILSLFLAGWTLSCFSAFLATPLFFLLDLCSQSLLQVIHHPPLLLDYVLIARISPLELQVSLAGLFGAGVWVKTKTLS